MLEAEILGLSNELAISVVRDAATIAHLAAMAVGLGSVVFADWTILSRIDQPLTVDQLAIVRRAHRLITLALVGLWLSGLTLLALKTGFDLALITPKLASKLATVVMLTATACGMGRFALPRISANVGRRLTSLPVPQRCALATGFALSSAGWGTALLLGGSGILRTAGNEVLAIVLVMHATALVLALGTALLMGPTSAVCELKSAGRSAPGSAGHA
jgi:hypothetical protein